MAEVNDSLANLLNLQSKQKERNVQILKEQQEQGLKRFGSQAGAHFLSPTGSRFQRGFGDLLAKGAEETGRALATGDIQAQRGLIGQEQFGEQLGQRREEFGQNIAQRELDRALNKERLGLERSRLLEQQRQFEESQPKWYDYLLGAVGGSGEDGGGGVGGLIGSLFGG